jgi:hypothetical protein
LKFPVSGWRLYVGGISKSHIRIRLGLLTGTGNYRPRFLQRVIDFRGKKALMTGGIFERG